jgi:hypothetical protein
MDLPFVPRGMKHNFNPLVMWFLLTPSITGAISVWLMLLLCLNHNNRGTSIIRTENRLKLKSLIAVGILMRIAVWQAYTSNFFRQYYASLVRGVVCG